MTVRRVPEAFTVGSDRHNAQKAWLDGFDTAMNYRDSVELRPLLERTTECWRCRHLVSRGDICPNCGAYNAEGK